MIFLKHLPAEEKASWQTTSHFVKKTSRYDNQETHCVDCLAYSIKQHCDVVVESCLYGGGGEALTHTDIELSGCGLGEACKTSDRDSQHSRQGQILVRATSKYSNPNAICKCKASLLCLSTLFCKNENLY
ncbi:Major prion protein [Trichinella spiralis]|uniref:Major prion protein n=1 Tax=Trichinella spiralis TaxID=6334 RepID=A0ABR3KRH1_TRISP